MKVDEFAIEGSWVLSWVMVDGRGVAFADGPWSSSAAGSPLSTFIDKETGMAPPTAS